MTVLAVFSIMRLFSLTYVTKLDMYGVLWSVAAIFGGGNSTCNVHESESVLSRFSLQVK